MNKINKSARLFSTLLPTCALLGCVSIVQPISSETLSPIADQTTGLFAQVEFDMQLAELVLLNPYLEADTPRVDDWDQAWSDLTTASRAIVEYSVEVVMLSRDAKQPDAVDRLIALITTLDQRIRSLQTAQDYAADYDTDSVLNVAARQKNLPLALRSAAPVVNDVARTVRRMIDTANDKFDLAFLEVQEIIMIANGPLLRYGGSLADRQDDTLRLLMLLDEARAGAEGSWQQLREADDDIMRLGGLTKSALSEAESVLLERLSLIVTTREQLRPTYIDYQSELKELYAIENDVKQILRATQFVIETWDKAQRTLATGRTADFTSITSTLARLAFLTKIKF